MPKRTNRQPTHLFHLLDDEVRKLPYGSISDMERALGEGEGWWHRRRKKGDLTTREFFAVLDYLGRDPVAFVREHVGSVDDLELDRPRGEPPALVVRARKRFDAGAKAPGVGEDFLAEIAEIGYRTPRAALDILETAIDSATATEIPCLLETAGAAFRALIELDAAHHCFDAALTEAHRQGDHRLFGNLLRRFSYVHADRGEPARALRLVHLASAILLREDDSVGYAKACVEQGQWLWPLGRQAESMRAFRTALRRLPESQGRYRCAAHQCLGVLYQDLGRPGEALQCVKRAMAYRDSVSRRDRAKLVWLEAGIRRELGEAERAISGLKRAITTFRDIHPGEAAIATCDLVRLLLEERRPLEAYHAALSMRALVEPLADNAVIAAAIAELLRGGQEGITLALTERVQRRIEAERRDRTAWHRLARTG